MKRSKLFYLLAVGLIASMPLVGCALKKPAPQAPATPSPTAQSPSRTPTNPTEMSKMSAGLAQEAAKVKGVNKAAVVLTFNTAIVGVDLKTGADANAVKSEVATVIKKSNNLIKNVLVTTDPELNSRLVRISQGIAEGRPADSFDKEITELRDRLSPTVR
ncbi:MAG: YhcN/YlaJ family sporulation lipoprotein [Desulfocucumaceae bacterium]